MVVNSILKQLTCSHRLSVLRTEQGNLCGKRGVEFQVYGCDLHKECSLERCHTAYRSCVSCLAEMRLAEKRKAAEKPKVPEKAIINDIKLAENVIINDTKFTIALGVTAAPRTPPTLQRTLASLSAAGFDNPAIFNDDTGRLGAFRNFRRALSQLAATKATHLLLCQDDIVLCKGVREYLESQPWPTEKTGLVSLYCSAKWSKTYSNRPNLVRLDSDNIWGCCALLFRRDAAEKVLQSKEISLRRRQDNIDFFLGSLLRNLGYEVWAYRPSLVQHVGDKSAIAGHGKAVGKRRSDTFVGESTDIQNAREKNVVTVSTLSDDLTVILFNYRRSKNMRQILDALASQQPKPRIFVWNNGEPFEHSAVDWMINSSRNVHCHATPYLCQQAETPFICRMDDDLVPVDNTLMADAVAALKRESDPNRILCAYGVVLPDDGTYQVGNWTNHVNKPAKDTPVDIAKGRIYWARREPMCRVVPEPHHHADMTVSLQLAERKRLRHLVLGGLQRRLMDLESTYDDGSKGGYERDPNHLKMRLQLSQEWVASTRELGV